MRHTFIATLALLLGLPCAQAQVFISDDFDDYLEAAQPRTIQVGDTIVPVSDDGWYDDIYENMEIEAMADSLVNDFEYEPIPGYYFLPLVFNQYTIPEPVDTLASPFIGQPKDITPGRFDLINDTHDRMHLLQQKVMINHPELVVYNVRTLPEPPRHFEAVIDPQNLQIVVREVTDFNPMEAAAVEKPEVERINWLHKFDALLQFSQAYISPNWYQGGSSSLNMIGQVIYNVKLNPAYHPKLLFETTVSYKLAMNDAPEDSLRNYSISEDIFQINSTFGIKARDRWYYSLTLQYKTQLLNSFVKNSHTMKSAFMSPGELNVGLGMTYNYSNSRVTFDANLAPLAWNMRTCINHNLDPVAFDIKNGHRVKNTIGSTIDMKLNWKIAYNINYSSRLFFFTDYKYLQADWENTLSFAINRFLTTQINVNMRYDSTSPAIIDSRWHKLQLKEILSFGFAYKFNTAG